MRISRISQGTTKLKLCVRSWQFRKRKEKKEEETPQKRPHREACLCARVARRAGSVFAKSSSKPGQAKPVQAKKADDATISATTVLRPRRFWRAVLYNFQSYPNGTRVHLTAIRCKSVAYLRARAHTDTRIHTHIYIKRIPNSIHTRQCNIYCTSNGSAERAASTALFSIYALPHLHLYGRISLIRRTCHCAEVGSTTLTRVDNSSFYLPSGETHSRAK